jgi:ABC-2 type transport system ATP-binding protein
MPEPLTAELRNVVKEYAARPGCLRALDGVTVSIAPGEVLGLIGPNRSGKTTLAKLLVSLCRPTSGEVRRFGRPASDVRTLARVGYVHEVPPFPRHETAARLLDALAALSGVRGDVRRKRVAGLIDRLGLADRCREPIAGYSKGMLARLALAHALLNEPALLVLDEPAEGLDPEGRDLLRGLIAERRRQGASVLLISHDWTEVNRTCDRVEVLQAGRLALGPSPVREPRPDPLVGVTA